jgi:hypothetical protein
MTSYWNWTDNVLKIVMFNVIVVVSIEFRRTSWKKVVTLSVYPQQIIIISAKSREITLACTSRAEAHAWDIRARLPSWSSLLSVFNKNAFDCLSL